MHAVPSGLQGLPPQKPATQSWLQHSATCEHGSPGGLHCVPPQKPLMQSSLQQSVVSLQALPSGEQIVSGAHLPDLHTSPAQHGVAASHAWPTCGHVLASSS